MLGGFSAHAGQTDLLAWLSSMAAGKPRVVVTHGEDDARGRLAEKVRERFGLETAMPAMGGRHRGLGRRHVAAGAARAPGDRAGAAGSLQHLRCFLNQRTVSSIVSAKGRGWYPSSRAAFSLVIVQPEEMTSSE